MKLALNIPRRAQHVLVVLLVVSALAPSAREPWKSLIGIGGLILFAIPMVASKKPNRFMQILSFAAAVYIWFGLFGAVNTLFLLRSALWGLSGTLVAFAFCLAITVVGVQMYHARLLYIRIGIVLAALQSIFFALFFEKTFDLSDLGTTLGSFAGLIISLGLLSVFSLAPKRISMIGQDKDEITIVNDAQHRPADNIKD